MTEPEALEFRILDVVRKLPRSYTEYSVRVHETWESEDCIDPYQADEMLFGYRSIFRTLLDLGLPVKRRSSVFSARRSDIELAVTFLESMFS